MNRVHLAEGQDAEKVAELIGGTLIAVNGDVALIVGGDLSKLKVGTE